MASFLFFISSSLYGGFLQTHQTKARRSLEKTEPPQGVFPAISPPEEREASRKATKESRVSGVSGVEVEHPLLGVPSLSRSMRSGSIFFFFFLFPLFFFFIFLESEIGDRSRLLFFFLLFGFSGVVYRRSEIGVDVLFLFHERSDWFKLMDYFFYSSGVRLEFTIKGFRSRFL